MAEVVRDPIQRWSTASVPRAGRVEYFAAALSEAVYPVRVDSADPETFQAEVSFAHLGVIAVCKMAGSPHRSLRGRPELARTLNHSFNLAMTLQSPWTADHRGRLKLLPRDVVIVDSQYPIDADVRDSFVAINVAMSEPWLRLWLPNPNVLAARRIPGDSLWGLALSSYLSELSPELAAAPPVPLPLLADQVGSLLALTANGLRNAIAGYAPAVRSLHERIHQCVAERCTESQLTAADVAAPLNISVRTLHRVFAAANQTFGEQLIAARARVALRMLTAPLFKRVTTAEIGRRAGFLSASHFARVIRNRTGLTPLQLRRQIASHDKPEPESEGDTPERR